MSIVVASHLHIPSRSPTPSNNSQTSLTTMREYSDEKGCMDNCFGMVPTWVRNLVPACRRQQQDKAEKALDEKNSTARPSAPYVPTHAAESFSRTATPRHMKKANEIL
ncbi:hypothetical protein F4808DRAFT_462824 [Astrocystis sublimbata]|nr:hypothetical protein F4808DRAFT_462824 [Astrocystis sublimbata]